MARQVIQVSTALDRQGYKLVVDLFTGEYKEGAVDESHPGLRYATEVVRTIGPQYSYAYIGIPVNTFGYEWAPAVALQRTGPAGKVKLRSRARISMIDYDGKSIPLLVGYLTQYAHSIDEDSVVGMVMDDRWLLSKVTAFGSGCYDPATKMSYFDAGKPLVFNNQGYPDCIDAPEGPRFAPGRLFGYKKSEAVEDGNEPSKGQARSRARSWTCADVLAYLRDMYYTGKRPPHPQNYGNQQISLFVDWPDSLGNQKGFDRIVRDFRLENLEVGECIARTCKKAGPYEILMEPVEWRGRLGIVQVNSRLGGSHLVGPRYGSNVDGGSISDCLQDSTRIAGGTIMESIVGYFDDVCIAGDPPAVEHQFSEADPSDGSIPVELEPAWSTEEETAFKAIIDANGNDQLAFAMACMAQPRVYAAWRISAGYNAVSATQWPSWVAPTNPRILAHLLSGYAMGNSNPRDWNPRETVLEYYDEVNNVWSPCSRFDDLTIIDEGKAFQVEGLRTGVNPVSFHGYPEDTSTLGANAMRITCAVEREFRIVGKATGDPNSTSSRVNNAGSRFTFMAVAEDGDYSHWERYLSRPNGNSVAELSENFPDACKLNPATGNQYLFSDLLDNRGGSVRLQRHADHRLEDVKRIDYNGILTMHTWNPSIKPGMQVIIDAGGNSITPKAVIKCVKFNSQTQSQEIELMSGDNSVIYDVPLPAPVQTSGGSPTPTGATTPKTSPTTGADDYVENQKTVSHPPDAAYEQGKPSSQSVTTSDSESGNPTVPAQEYTNSSKPETEAERSKRNTQDIIFNLRQSAKNAEIDEQDRRESQRAKSSIRTGDQMSKGPDEDYYAPGKAAARKRAAAEQALVDKALKKSVRPADDEVE